MRRKMRPWCRPPSGQLEIMAIKNSAIGKARQMMADAKKAKVQKTTPTAYKDALQALMAADAYIGQNLIKRTNLFGP